MKILFINISDTRGGAAKAAYRVGKYLKSNYNTENLFLVRNKYLNDEAVVQTRKNRTQAFIERWVNIFFNLIGLQYFYLPFSPKFIINKAKEFKPDVISLNNTIGGYFKTSDLRKISRIAPVVWTFHDMWPFTANAAHTFGDESWKQLKAGKKENHVFPWIGLNTGNFLLSHKKKIYDKSDFSVITPSKWLLNLAGESPLLKEKRKYQIYNGVDLNTFRPLDKDECRKKHNLPLDADVLMFSAERLKNNRWKGGNELIEILHKMHRKINKKIYLIIVGKGNIKEIQGLEKYVIKQTGYINNEADLVDYYCCADLIVYPSKADTLSFVLIESIACGTPAVTYNICGSNEIIVEGKSGFLVKPFDKDEFVQKTVNALKNKIKLEELSKSARKHAEENFLIESIAKQYHDVFVEEIKLRSSGRNNL